MDKVISERSHPSELPELADEMRLVEVTAPERYFQPFKVVRRLIDEAEGTLEPLNARESLRASGPGS